MPDLARAGRLRSLGRHPAVLAGLALLVLALVSPRFVPYNMDEFAHYHALGCAQFPVSQRLNVYREGCGQYDLRLPGTRTFLPLRSYDYIGSLPSLPFYGLWKLLDDPRAARVQGAVFFLLATLLGARLLRVRFSAALVGSLVFPVYLASFLVDLGPVGISIVLLLAGLLLSRAAAQARRPASRVSWAAAAGFTLFLGVWVKLVFAWCLPVALAFAWLETRNDDRVAVRRTTLLPALALGACLVLPTLLLVLAEDRRGLPYYEVVRLGQFAEQAVEEVSNRLSEYFWNGSRILPRTLQWPFWPVDVLPAVLSLALVGFGLRTERRRAIAGWTLAAVATFGLVSLSAQAKWPHHFVFALVFLVLALALALDALAGRRRDFVAATLLVSLFWGSLLVRLPWAAEHPEAARAKDELLAFVRRKGLDRDTIQVHTSWGTYYIGQLFGDASSAVLFIRSLPDRPELLAEVRRLADGTGRGVLLISGRRWERIQTDAVTRALGRPTHTWRFDHWWAVEYLR